ncbi:hypothetical protein [Pelolinea submarina]|uniref:UbiA prenyltransferase family protein n=1 Tax=Pelolinea submarina TaxID=913107 RepID=A0A3E0AHJ3_9CHLR|nr:hypothetical protein [Pelolinea submarina]REG11054.1 hypothetical protein DFR64_0927 [Pelolinea submarina]
MIKTLQKLFPYFLQSIDWGELLNGIVFILLGMAFTYHYGYQVYWRNFIQVVLWFVFYKAGIYSLNAIFTNTLSTVPLDGGFGRLSPAQFRELLERFLWIFAILFIAMSFVPLTQMIGEDGINRLTLIIIALIYLSDLLFLIDKTRELLSGFQELFYGFVTAFLLPSLFFSFTRDYLKVSLIMIAFPLFLQLIAWKVCNNLEILRISKRISAGSMLERLDALNGLSVTTTLLLLGSITVFLDQELLPLWSKLIILPAGLLSAWLVFRSIKKQEPNWDWALLIVRILPAVSALTMFVGLWNH